MDQLVFTVAEFCRAHRISKRHFYDRIRDGSGPRIMKDGFRTLISAEAAAEWRRRMEASGSAAMDAARNRTAPAVAARRASTEASAGHTSTAANKKGACNG